MDLRHLRTFQEIVRQGSFLRAAETLQYAQSTITLHMQQLENDLNVQLFDRQSKRVQLTEAGRVLRDEADQILARVARLRQAMAEIANGYAGDVRLGVTEPTASRRLPAILMPFCRERPQVRIGIEVGGSQMICQRIAAGVLDIGLCAPPAAHLGLEFEPLFTEPMGVLIPDVHPLAKAESIAIEDLRDQRLLLTERTCAYRMAAENMLIAGGTAPRDIIEIGSISALTYAVQGQLGIALVPIALADGPLQGAVLRPLRDTTLGVPIGFVRPADPPPPSRALDDLLARIRDQIATVDTRPIAATDC